MAYFILGLAALVLGLLALRSFARANPAVLSRRLTVGPGVTSLLGAGALFLRGFLPLAVPLAMFGSWLIWGTTSGPWGQGRWRKSPGQTSRVVTDHLEMELDHDTGEMHGRVLKGLFAGRSIDSLSAADLALLWQDYQAGLFSERDLETAAFTVFLYGRIIGAAAENDDHLNRGRNMDTRTPEANCAQVL